MKRTAFPCLLRNSPGCCSCPSPLGHAQAADLYKAKCPCAMAQMEKKQLATIHVRRRAKEIGCRSPAVITDGKLPRCPSTGTS